MSLLKVENLKITVDGASVIEDVSFEIEEKGIYVILGKNEFERTLLAKALAGVTALTGGSIFYKDIELSNKKQSKKLRTKIGYVPKESFFYPDMTAYEVLDFTGKLRGVSVDKRIRQIKEALELVALSELKDAFVKDLNFSEKKRLLLANALIGNPNVIIIDEPCVNVLSEDSELIREVIEMLGERKTVVILSEKISLANELAKYIGIISSGKIVFWSSLDNIKEKLDNDPNALLKIFVAFTDDALGNDGGDR